MSWCVTINVNPFHLVCNFYIYPSGEVLGELLSILTNPRGLHQLTQLPRGSAEVELMGLLPIYYVYHFLESTEQWDILGKEMAASNVELMRKMNSGKLHRTVQLK